MNNRGDELINTSTSHAMSEVSSGMKEWNCSVEFVEIGQVERFGRL
jgi:hypothetical protein